MRASSRTDRRGSRWLLRAVVMAVLLASSLAVAAPAQAVETINCTPMSDPACKDLTPAVQCIWSNGDGTSTIAWGYSNPSDKILHIDIGGKNNMKSGPDDQGQWLDFPPGTVQNAFVTTVTGTDRTWTLGSNKASTSDSTPACPTKPVSMIGSAHALLLGIALMAAAALSVLVGRRGRLGVPA